MVSVGLFSYPAIFVVELWPAGLRVHLRLKLINELIVAILRDPAGVIRSLGLRHVPEGGGLFGGNSRGYGDLCWGVGYDNAGGGGSTLIIHGSRGFDDRSVGA